jgi:hypothetical protein
MATRPSQTSLDLNRVTLLHSEIPRARDAGSFPAARNQYDKMSVSFDVATMHRLIMNFTAMIQPSMMDFTTAMHPPQM